MQEVLKVKLVDIENRFKFPKFTFIKNVYSKFPKKKQNLGGKTRDPAKPRIQDPGGLPRIENKNNKSKVNIGGPKKPAAEASKQLLRG